MAPAVEETLYENFLVHFGWTTNILTDQGKTFETVQLYALAIMLTQSCQFFLFSLSIVPSILIRVELNLHMHHGILVDMVLCTVYELVLMCIIL